MNLVGVICEDEPSILQYISDQLILAMKQIGIDLQLDRYTSGDDLLYALDHKKKEYEIYFMDIEMPGTNGIDVCQRFKHQKNGPLIIFISNKESLVFQSFEVHPFRFIRKNHFMEECEALVLDIKTYLLRNARRIITIKEAHGDTIHTFPADELIYIEVYHKYCTAHTVNTSTEIKCPLSDFEDQLTEYGFLKPHRSYLVNYRFISNISKSEITLTSGDILPLSRRKVDEIRQEYLRMLRKGS